MCRLECEIGIEEQRKANLVWKYFRYSDTLCHGSRIVLVRRVLLVPGSWISSFESAARTSPAPFCASASGCNFLSQFQPRLKKIASDGALDQREERDDGTTTPIPFPEPIDAAVDVASVTRLRGTEHKFLRP